MNNLVEAVTPRRPSTPSHNPIHGVRLSERKIRALISHALPGHDVEATSQLPSGKSFNNRIYFISLFPKCMQNDNLLRNGVVLKIPGWNFGADKIENEVINLLLLETHCPQIPVPRILAWSEGGDVVQRVHRLHNLPLVVSVILDTDTRNTPKDRSKPPHSGDRGIWILMSRLPGQILQPSQIDNRNIESIMQSLAGYMSQWRRLPAPTQQIGNLRFLSSLSEHDASIIKPATLAGLQITVHGILIGASSSAMCSSRDFYETKIGGELAILKSNENYALFRSVLVALVEEFISNILPNTALLQHHRKHHTVSTFTHYDFSPRNILIEPDSSGTQRVSGIVDFEFAGFFPAEEEFSNTCVAGEGDWPPLAWQSFVSCLDASHVEVPHGELWKQACAMYRIIDNIAPWQLREGSTKGKELEVALQQAKFKVEESISLLKQALVPTYD